MKSERLDHTFDWSSIVEYRDGRLYWKIDRISGRGRGYIKTPKGSLTCKDKPGSKNKYKVRNFAYRCVSYSEHIVIWYLLKGEIPDGFEVRHIDNNPLNNHIENLVLGTHQDNMYDLVRSHSKNSLSSSNTSGFKGVHWDKTNERWVVRITVNGKRKCVGYFKTLEEAQKAMAEYTRGVL